MLDILHKYCKMAGFTDGAIAQLGERLHGMQEVRGSIPLGSTNRFYKINRPVPIV